MRDRIRKKLDISEKEYEKVIVIQCNSLMVACLTLLSYGRKTAMLLYCKSDYCPSHFSFSCKQLQSCSLTFEHFGMASDHDGHIISSEQLRFVGKMSGRPLLRFDEQFLANINLIIIVSVLGDHYGKKDLYRK